MEMLVAMRALQGIGAGILVANAQAAVGDLFPPAQLGKYNGMLSGVHALASLVGPLLGVGVGLTIPASLSAAQNAVAHGELGLVTSLSKFARSFGGIVGLGVLGAVLHVQTLEKLDGPEAGEALAHATANLLWAVVATFGLAVLVSLRLRDRALRSDFEPVAP
jgi:MFS family permease